MADGAGAAGMKEPARGEGGGPGAGGTATDRVIWLVLLAAAAATAAVYPRLPEQMIIHWDAAGRPDDWAHKSFAAWMPIGTAAALALLMRFLPALDPRGENYRRFSGAFDLIRLATVLFMVGVHVLVILAGLGVPVAMDRIMPVAVGLLLVLLGNVMGQVRHNYFVGIRTPWTLADEEVWRRTHRMGGRLFVLGGLAIAAGGLVGGPWLVAAILTSLTVAGLGPVVYSYWIWRQGKASRQDG